MNELSLAEIAIICKGRLSAEKYADVMVNSAVTDSRDAALGRLFVPIRGERVNGHDYIAAAISGGCAASLCDERRDIDVPLVYVEDCLKALELLAEYNRGLYNIPIVGITGSVGKTTVKDMTASVLAQRYSVLKTKGNLNTGIGLPLTLLDLEERHEIAVIEMAMRNFGEIRELTMLTRPNTAVITNIGISHIELLKSREGILRAKLEILEGLQDGGSIVFYRDDDMLAPFEGKYENIYWFGTANDNFFYPENIEYYGLEGTGFTLCSKNERINVKIPVPGRHLLTSALCAASIGRLYGLSLEEIKLGLEAYTPSGSRMKISNLGGLWLIDDSYNASPASMEAALEVLSLARGRKVAVLGDMLELGESSEQAHIELGRAAAKSADVLLTYGERARGCHTEFATVSGNARHFDKKQDLCSYIISVLEPGDCVLVKASRGLEFETITEAIFSHKSTRSEL